MFTSPDSSIASWMPAPCCPSRFFPQRDPSLRRMSPAFCHPPAEGPSGSIRSHDCISLDLWQSDRPRARREVSHLCQLRDWGSSSCLSSNQRPQSIDKPRGLGDVAFIKLNHRDISSLSRRNSLLLVIGDSVLKDGNQVLFVHNQNPFTRTYPGVTPTPAVETRARIS